jgi:glycine cleavage system regulatory protein
VRAAAKLVLTAAGPDRVGVTAAITKAVVASQGNVDSGRLTSLGGDYCIHMLVSIPEAREQAFVKDAQAAVGKFGGNVQCLLTHTHTLES